MLQTSRSTVYRKSEAQLATQLAVFKQDSLAHPEALALVSNYHLFRYKAVLWAWLGQG